MVCAKISSIGYTSDWYQVKTLCDLIYRQKSTPINTKCVLLWELRLLHEDPQLVWSSYHLNILELQTFLFFLYVYPVFSTMFPPKNSHIKNLMLTLWIKREIRFSFEQKVWRQQHVIFMPFRETRLSKRTTKIYVNIINWGYKNS